MRSVQALLEFYELESAAGVYELRLTADGQGIEWVSRGPQGEEVTDIEPAASVWLRLKLWWLSLVVPEEEL